MNYNNNNYKKNLKKLGECSTVETFFQNYFYIQKPTDIKSQNKILFFRKGCTPLWQEQKCGGCWIFVVQNKLYKDLNKIWEDLLLGCIGERFSNSHVIGVVLSIRRNNKAVIEIWMRDRDEGQKVETGLEFGTIIGIKPYDLVYFYKNHFQSLKEGRTIQGSQVYAYVGPRFYYPVLTPYIPVFTTFIPNTVSKIISSPTKEELKELEKEEFEI